jgi:uncharacterized protein
MKRLTIFGVGILILLATMLTVCAYGVEIPAVPTTYFTDYTGTVDQQTGYALNQSLVQLEKDAGVQCLAVIYDKLPDNTVLEDYTYKVAQAWKVGLKEHHSGSGVILFIFKGSRKLRIEVGNGMEGKIPDVLAKRIIDREIVPQFKAGNYVGGVVQGVNAIIAASKGEYQGTGTTVHEQQNGDGEGLGGWWILIVLGGILLIIIIGLVFNDSSGGYTYTGGGGYSGGSGSSGSLGDYTGYSGGYSGGSRRSSYSSPSSSSSDSDSSWGSFSGGGGSFSGGGASGGW